LDALDAAEGGIGYGTPWKIIPFMEEIEFLSRAGKNSDLDRRHALLS
jgi:hypothetical protein